MLTATSYRQHLQIIDEQLDAKKLLTHQQFQDQSDYRKSYASTSSVIFKVDLRSEITNQGYRICGLVKQIIISSSTIRYACNGDAVLTPKANAICEAPAPPNRHIVLIGRRKPSVQAPPHEICCVSRTFEAARDWELIDRNPCFRVKPSKHPRMEISIYAREQLSALLDAIREKVSTQYYLLTLLLAGTPDT